MSDCDVPAGWKLVPVEPTEAMLRAGVGEWLGRGAPSFSAGWQAYVLKTWNTMLSAAPSPPVGEGAPTDAEAVAGALLADLRRVATISGSTIAYDDETGVVDYEGQFRPIELATAILRLIDGVGEVKS